VAKDSKKMKVLLAVPWDDRRGGVMAVVDNVATVRRRAGTMWFFHTATGSRLTGSSTQLGFPGVALRLTMPFGGGLRGALRTLRFRSCSRSFLLS
jgi:hypothetical protein